MEPIRETREILEQFAEYGDDTTARQLAEVSRLVTTLVPEVVGISIAMVEDELTFTLVASDEEIAALDAAQYADVGPCVAAVDTGDPVVAPAGDALDESVWHLHARATAAAGVRSTLSVPIKEDGEVVGGINLYASTLEAFEGRVQEVAEALGSSAREAVRNADLSFSSRGRAERGPTHLNEFDAINRAVGVLTSARGVGVQEARSMLRDCALRAGLTESQTARALTAFLTT